MIYEILMPIRLFCNSVSGVQNWVLGQGIFNLFLSFHCWATKITQENHIVEPLSIYYPWIFLSFLSLYTNPPDFSLSVLIYMNLLVIETQLSIFRNNLISRISVHCPACTLSSFDEKERPVHPSGYDTVIKATDF